ncbi:MAG: hypothetical protein WC421_10170 [Elusimicrobiales bacterium]
MIYLANTGRTKPVEIISGNISRAEVAYRFMGKCYCGRLWDLEADGGFYEIAAAIRARPAKSNNVGKRKNPRCENPRAAAAYPQSPLHVMRTLKDWCKRTSRQ